MSLPIQSSPSVKVASKNPPYFLFFVLSVFFVAISLLAYNYAISRLSKELVIYNTSHLNPTSLPIIDPTPFPSISSQPSSFPTNINLSPSPQDSSTATPTSATPVLKTYQNSQYQFKVNYWPSRSLFEDQTTDSHRFVFVHPQGNFVIHIGQTTWAWLHTGRELTNTFPMFGKPTFVFQTSSQKIVDFTSDSAQYFTIQCVHNGLADLISECNDFISSFSFVN